MELKDFAKFRREIENQARGIAGEFTKDQKALMSYFVNSDNELLCMSEISGIFHEYEVYNKVLTQLVSFGLLIETQSKGQRAFTKGNYFLFFEEYFKK
jgi:hypothetical protein